METPKILIVDDEEYNVDYLQQELEDCHYTLLKASNGKEALELVQAERPDLVLLDIMMPVMDGFEVLQNLKHAKATRDIPVIVISASNNLQSVVRGIQLGAEDYLPKPFEPVLLHARISSCLEKKRLGDLQNLYLKGLERELDIAREIQQGFLPFELPRAEGWEIAASLKAAREVAGDFYDSFLLPDGSIVFVVGDVCGKGVGAALFMTLFRSLIRATSTTDDFLGRNDQHILTPVERLQQAVGFTNAYIVQTHAEANMFATIFIGLIDPRDGSLTYINCGHEPALVMINKGVQEHLLPTGPAVGIIPDAVFNCREMKLEPGATLLAFTDGIPDALNALGESFGSGQLHELLVDAPNSSNRLIQVIEDKLLGFIGEASQFDDITLLAIRRE